MLTLVRVGSNGDPIVTPYICLVSLLLNIKSDYLVDMFLFFGYLIMKFLHGENLRWTLIIKQIVNTNAKSGSFVSRKSTSRLGTYKLGSFLQVSFTK